MAQKDIRCLRHCFKCGLVVGCVTGEGRYNCVGCPCEGCQFPGITLKGATELGYEVTSAACLRCQYKHEQEKS